jgi:hypothetical protein
MASKQWSSSATACPIPGSKVAAGWLPRLASLGALGGATSTTGIDDHGIERHVVGMRDPIATRTLHVEGEPSRVVTVTIGRPFQDPDPRGDWICKIDIQGIPDPGEEQVHGIDACQAIELAFVGARQRLDRSGLSLVWAGQEPGETGFSTVVPYIFGRLFSRKIERYIEQEIEWLTEVIEQYKARRAGTP